MNYIQKILFNGETVQYNGRVHWIIYVPGVFYLGLSIYLAYSMHAWNESPDIHSFTSSLINRFPFTENIPEFITTSLFLTGSYKLIKAFIIANFTELVVTNFRIIAKFGVYETTTIEMDKNKIAGITIHQSPIGKIFNYGTVTLRGFVGDISGIPVLARPYDIQKYTTGRRF